MIDLTARSLPNTVYVNGRLFSIYTDFRVWMRFEKSLTGHRRGEFLPYRYLFKNDYPVLTDLNDLLAFSRPEKKLPRQVGSAGSGIIAIDFELDANLIYAAFLQQYGIDLIDIPELHWHKFLALLDGLKGTKMDEVMGYRFYEKQVDNRTDQYEQLREAWEIEVPLSEEEQAELDEFNAKFGG
ncbi:Gp15 family bacteriophage protein [Suilimivivens sp.]|uniref:Gp15 family bacteriophage protein n=1 Tax=Suilimivivens sp. TaxID=2981669 RepID=UPI0030791B45